MKTFMQAMIGIFFALVNCSILISALVLAITMIRGM